jgi:hypothetical protein
MNTKRFADFIANSPENNGPEFTAGIINNSGMNSTVKTTGGGVQLLGSKIGFNMNSTADQTINLVGGSTFIVTDVVITNASTSLTTARNFQIQDAPLRGGNIIAINNNAAAVQPPNVSIGLTASNQYINSNSEIYNQLNYITIFNSLVVGNTLYASLGTPQGGAATADIRIYGYIIN